MKEPSSLKKAWMYTKAIAQNRDKAGVKKHAASSAKYGAVTTALIVASPFTAGLTLLPVLWTGYKTYDEAKEATKDPSVVSQVASEKRAYGFDSVQSPSSSGGLVGKITGAFKGSSAKTDDVEPSKIHPYFSKDKKPRP